MKTLKTEAEETLQKRVGVWEGNQSVIWDRLNLKHTQVEKGKSRERERVNISVVCLFVSEVWNKNRQKKKRKRAKIEKQRSRRIKHSTKWREH